MDILSKLNADDQRAYAAAENAYARYTVLKYNLSKEELEKIYEVGEPTETNPHTLVLEDWGPLVERETGESVGYLRRIGGRPLTEILQKLSTGLDCAGLRIDEYFSLGTQVRYDRKWETWPDNVRQVAVYAVQGGSEGHYVHVDVYTSEDFSPLEVTTVFLLKTFLGMEHALRLSNELTRLLTNAQ